MEISLSTIVLIALIAAASLWVVRKIRSSNDDALVEGIRDDMQVSHGEDDADSERTIYQISNAAYSAYETAARPEDLDEDPDFSAGIELLSSSAFSVEDVTDYFRGDNAVISSMAAKALGRREDGSQALDAVLGSIGSVATWPLILGLDYLARTVPQGANLVGPVMGKVHGYFYDRQARLAIEQFVADRLSGGETIVFSYELSGLEQYEFDNFKSQISNLADEVRAALQAALEKWTSTHIDLDYLKSIGRVHQSNGPEPDEVLIEHDGLAAAVDDIRAAVLADPPRSVLLVGEAGVGKTTAVNVFTRELAADGWVIFQAGQAEFLAGQSYIGQLEQRVQEFLTKAGNRRVLWIIPNFHQMVFAGTHKYSSVSILDLIAPAIERADLRIIGLTTNDGLKNAAKKHPSLATLLSVQRIEPLPPEATRELAFKALTETEGRRPEHRVLIQEAWELAHQYISNLAPPGNLFRLLALAQRRGARDDSKLSVPLLHQTLAELTGLPVAILDDRKALDIDGLVQLFNSRVLGQREAVECLVERVAMMKAGLSDPGRPAGVFLFAGPTGTGKTELAKTLAEWLFGSPDRMVRYDMSEFQSPGDLEQMLGGEGYEANSIVLRLRDRPFSVILLDEFEKAHPKVWDLFLQVFDDGRLTDRQGRTADFRHTIIIMTSNLGATIPSGPRLGFVGGDGGFDENSVLMTVQQTFRKEFINRFDRVVVFQPLSRELMRSILEMELRRVQTRRGFRSRLWALEWDEPAIDFLLDKGFTPDMGARPLKRAVERYLLSPLAMTIVRHEAPEGDQFLFVTRKGNELDVRFVDPDMPAEHVMSDYGGADGGDLSVKSITRAPAGTTEEIAALRASQTGLQASVTSEAWQAIKSGSYARMETPEFWGDADRFDVLDRIERVGRIEGALKRATSLLDRLEGQGAGKRKRVQADLVGSLGQTLFLLEAAVGDLLGGQPSDAILQVSQSGAEGAEDHFFEEIVAMYRNWVKNRRMKLELIETKSSRGQPPAFLALVSGFGAHSLLAGETGRHVLDLPKSSTNRAGKLSVEVRVAPQPASWADASERGARYQECLRLLKEYTPRQPKIVRHYKKSPSPLVRDVNAGWRTGNVDRVLGGDFDLF